MAELVQSRLREDVPRGSEHAFSPVVLDPRLLAGFAAPVPSQVVDCIIGIAVREAGFRELSTDIRACEEWAAREVAERHELETVHRVLEDYYVSVRLQRLSPVLGKYLEARARAIVAPLLDRWRDKAGGAVTRGAVLEAWLAVDMYGEEPPPAMDGRLLRGMQSLRELANRYIAIDNAEERCILALGAWRLLQEYPRGADDLSSAVRQVVGEGSDYESADCRMRRNIIGGGDVGSFVDLSTCLVDELRGVEFEKDQSSGHVPDDAVSLTSDLRDLGVLAAETVVRDAEFDAEAYDRVRRKVEREIADVRRLFSRLDEIEARWRHGLRRGKLDGRRLSRVASGKETVFRLRDARHRISMALIFLIDVSASMKPHMATVNRAACVVAEALRGLSPAVWYEVLTYTSGGLQPGAMVQLTRLASPGKTLSLSNVWSEGGTPTGEAIAVALLLLRRRTARRRLVLHFTDGHPKNTYVVRQALEMCRREHVDVVTVSVGTPQETLYGSGKCEVAYTVSELPGVLYRLLPRLYR